MFSGEQRRAEAYLLFRRSPLLRVQNGRKWQPIPMRPSDMSVPGSLPV